jgi:hypothetical protein
MPWLAWILSSAVLGGIVKTVLTAVGVGAVTFVGVGLLMDQLEAYAASAMTGAGGDLSGLIGLFGIGTALNLVLSGCSIRIALFATKQFRITQ